MTQTVDDEEGKRRPLYAVQGIFPTFSRLASSLCPFPYFTLLRLMVELLSGPCGCCRCSALEALRRRVNLDEEITVAWSKRFLVVKSSPHLITEGLQNLQRRAWHKRHVGKILEALSTARVQADTKQKSDAVAKALIMLSADLVFLISQVKDKFGIHLHERRLPGQSYYWSFEEKLADGCTKALAHGASCTCCVRRTASEQFWCVHNH